MKEDKVQNAYKIIMLIFLTAAITFIVTTVCLYGKLGNTKIKYVNVSGSSSVIGSNIQTILNYIDNNYVGEVDQRKLYEEALKGLVNGLGDEYSQYITADNMGKYLESAQGQFTGIGVYLTVNKETNQIEIIMPIKGGPSEDKLMPGDILLKVDGEAFDGDHLDDATAKLKSGVEGTTVKVEILRNGDTLEVEITRQKVNVNRIEGEIFEDKIGYIAIPSFDVGFGEEFYKVFNDLKEKNISSLIIDLRGNGGGIVDEAVAMADYMLDKDSVIMYLKNKNEEKTTVAKNDKVIDMPIVILVDGYTASSSEILTAALRENLENSLIIGKKTYGKGVIQSIVTLTDGSGLKLTTEEYLTPKHNAINKNGITPDYEVELPEKEGYIMATTEDDTQFQKAIELLK